jgi:hypothetical protein
MTIEEPRVKGSRVEDRDKSRVDCPESRVEEPEKSVESV